MAKTPTDPPEPAARAAAIAWHRSQHDLICDRVEPWEHGRLVRATAFPAYWDYNLVYAEGPLADVDAGALARVADVHHGDLAHRQIQVEDPAAGAALRPQFEERGWRATALVFLHLAGDPRSDPGSAEFRGAPDDAAEPLRREWYATEPWAREASALDRFIRDESAVHARLGGHVLLADGDGPGGLAGYVRIRTAGDTGEITEAYATPGARGRGLGAALVAAGARAIAASGARQALIVADADDRPQRLYQRLGFRPVWTLHQFLRLPGTHD